MSKNYDKLFPNNYTKRARVMVVDFANGQITMQKEVSLINPIYPISMDERKINVQNCKPEEIIEDLNSILDGEVNKEKPKIVQFVKDNVKDKDGKPLKGEDFNKAVSQRLAAFRGDLYNKKKIEAMDSLLTELSDSSVFKKLDKLI